MTIITEPEEPEEQNGNEENEGKGQEEARKKSGDAMDFEAKHVHEVYEEIAEHFSETRYKVS